MKKNTLIIVGELSGEEHAASFLPQLMEKNPDYSFWGVGGDMMSSWGVELLYHLKDFSSVGFTEVIRKIFFYLDARKNIMAEVKRRGTTLAILVDFQGFNLSLAPLLKKQGVKVLYYVAPQAWAWKEWRTKILANSTDQLFCILPFEEKWFKDRGVFQSIGTVHPLLVKALKMEKNISSSTGENSLTAVNEVTKILLLPGSRISEVSRLLPIMMDTLEKLDVFHNPKIEVGIVCSSTVPLKYVKIYGDKIRKIYPSQLLELALSEATMCLAASGTVTLSCGLFQVPTIVCYKVSLFNEWVVRSFIKYEGYVSLVNLFLEKKVFPEFLQEDCAASIIAKTMKDWLEHPEKMVKMRNELGKLSALSINTSENSINMMNSYFK